MADNNYFDNYSNDFIDDNIYNFNKRFTDYNYDLEEAQNNLFWAGNFIEHKNGILTKSDNAAGRYNVRPVDNAEFRIRSISLGMPKLSFETKGSGEVLHTEFLSKVDFVRNIAITWQDDVWRSIRKYHLDWINRWYDRRRDCLRNGPDGKLRGLDIILYHYVDGANDPKSPLDSLPVPQPILMIQVRGMKPIDIGNLDLNAEGGKEDSFSCNYSINRCQFLYNNNLQFKDRNGEYAFPSKESTYMENEDAIQGIWKPLGLSNEDSNWGNEGWRLARSITQQIAGEGEIG